MTVQEIGRWLLSDWTHPVLGGLGALFVYAHVWAAVRVSYEKVQGAPMPRNKLVLWLDVLADLANNVPGAVNRILRRGGHGIFLPSPSEDPKAEGENQDAEPAASSSAIRDVEAAVVRLLAAEDSLRAIRERRATEPGASSATLEAGEAVFVEERDNALQALRDLRAGGAK